MLTAVNGDPVPPGKILRHLAAIGDAVTNGWSVWRFHRGVFIWLACAFGKGEAELPPVTLRHAGDRALLAGG